MDVGMTMDELAVRLPLEQFIPITEAAKILGGGKHRINSLMDLVMTGGLSSWSHSCPYQAPTVRTIAKIGLEEELPNLTPDTDPATVLIDSKDVLWRWCAELESLFLSIGDENLPPRDKVETRFNALKARSIELKTGSKPVPLGSTDSGTTSPAGRWPWGNHHTELLGHLEAAALEFWASYDHKKPITAPKNEVIENWLQERGVAKHVSVVMASMLRLNGLKRH